LHVLKQLNLLFPVLKVFIACLINDLISVSDIKFRRINRSTTNILLLLWIFFTRDNVTVKFL